MTEARSTTILHAGAGTPDYLHIEEFERVLAGSEWYIKRPYLY